MAQEKKEVTIYVETKPYPWPKDEITYEEVVRFEDPAYPGSGKTYSVKYKRGEGNKPEGVLNPGASAKVKDEMSFSVSETGQS